MNSVRIGSWPLRPQLGRQVHPDRFQVECHQQGRTELDRAVPNAGIESDVVPVQQALLAIDNAEDWPAPTEEVQVALLVANTLLDAEKSGSCERRDSKLAHAHANTRIPMLSVGSSASITPM